MYFYKSKKLNPYAIIHGKYLVTLVHFGVTFINLLSLMQRIEGFLGNNTREH